MSYRIKTVAQLTGITPTTIRAWERRYELFEPARSRNRYRVYTDDEVTTLKRVKSLVDRGMKPGEAFELVRRRASDPLGPAAPDASLGEVRTALLDALLLLDRDRASQTLAELDAVPSIRKLDEVFLPLMTRVGDLWAAGDCSVAQEHFSSAFVREKLSGILEASGPVPVVAPEAICAGAPGELHEFGLMSVAIHLATRGWRVTYLGADLPLEDLGVVVSAREPALVCTSLIRSSSPGECEELATRMRGLVPPGAMIALGGRGLPPDLASRPEENIYFLRTIQELFEIGGVAAH